MEANKPVDWSWLVHNYHGLKLNVENKTVETTYDDRGRAPFGAADLNYSLPIISVELKVLLEKMIPTATYLLIKITGISKQQPRETRKDAFFSVIQVSDDLSILVTLLKIPTSFRLMTGSSKPIWI